MPSATLRIIMHCPDGGCDRTGRHDLGSMDGRPNLVKGARKGPRTCINDGYLQRHVVNGY